MTTRSCQTTLWVQELTDGILDPQKPMLGPVQDGGYIIANTSPGCWGPMITPELKGGHEVTRPVAVEGAQVGDSLAIRLKSITVTSLATASGNDQVIADDRFLGDPYVARRCPECGTLYPKTVINGIGEEAIHCANCGAEISPFGVTHGYTVVFDENSVVGVTMHQAAAEKIAGEAARYASLPEPLGSEPNPDLCAS